MLRGKKEGKSVLTVSWENILTDPHGNFLFTLLLM